jgi:hypothetical protein
MKETEIIESCGCVFCDLNCPAVIDDKGRLVHLHPKHGTGASLCTNADRVAAQEDDLVEFHEIGGS